jgi:hypothetical protein
MSKCISCNDAELLFNEEDNSNINIINVIIEYIDKIHHDLYENYKYISELVSSYENKKDERLIDYYYNLELDSKNFFNTFNNLYLLMRNCIIVDYDEENKSGLKRLFNFNEEDIIPYIDIKNGEILAYYKMKVYKDLTPNYNISTPMEIIRKKCNELSIDTERKNNETFYQYKKRLIYDIDDKQPILISLHNKKIEKPFRDMYHFTVYKKNGDSYKNLVGDLYDGSLPTPKNNIPYWAYFSNEPSPTKTYNSDIDVQLKENYKDRNTIKEGDTVVYALVSYSVDNVTVDVLTT